MKYLGVVCCLQVMLQAATCITAIEVAVIEIAIIEVIATYISVFSLGVVSDN